MIGLVGRESSKQISHITKHLNNDDWILIDNFNYPEKENLEIDDDYNILINGLDSSSIKSYFIENYYTDIHEEIDLTGPSSIDGRSIIASAEKESFLKSMIMIEENRGKYIINSPKVDTLHQRKVFQLHKLAEAGIPVPDTAFTNCVNTFSKFSDEVILKSLAGIGQAGKISTNELVDNNDLLDNSPITIQEYISGADIRVYVLEGEILGSFEVKSPEKVDYRGAETGYKKVDLPLGIKNHCVKANEILDMKYSAIDLRLDSENYYLLECNPAGYFAGIEEYYGEYFVSKPIAEILQKN